MKVLLVADVLGEENNGTTIACMNLYRYLVKQGDEVRILCCDQDKKGKEQYYVVPTLSLGHLIDKIIEKNCVVLAKPKKSIILEALKDVDIVHIMMPFALGEKTAKLAHKLGIPITAGFHVQAENFTAHVQLMNAKWANHLTYKSFYKKLYRYVDAIHYPTHFIRKLFEREIKKKTNGYVISNGVNSIYQHEDVEKISKTNGKFNILFIGRLSKEKSHKLLVKAISLSKHKDEIQLYFAGKGPRENETLEYAEKKQINKPIIEFMTRDRLVKLINGCDLYVHPAEIEIEAISCLEAISCGLVPVISNSKRSATNDFALTDKNLFQYNKPQDLADKIDYWIEHPKEKEELSKKYLGYAKKFDQDYCMEQMRKMLLDYVGREKSITGKYTYYRDSLHDDFAENNIKTQKLDDNFKIIHTNKFFNFVSFILYYIIAKPIVWLLNKCYYRQKIVNKKVLKECKKKGYFIYANHTAAMGDAFTPNLLSNKRNYVVASHDTFSLPGLRTIVVMLGAIPVFKDGEGYNNYVKAMEYRIKQNRTIALYSEAHIWPYYTDIRPFTGGSFRYPYDMDAPVYCLTNTWVKAKLKRKPKLVTYVDGPFYPDKSLERTKGIEKLRNEVYETMKKRSESVQQYEYIRYIKIEDRGE